MNMCIYEHVHAFSLCLCLLAGLVCLLAYEGYIKTLFRLY
jgi:hypothetical protein